MQAKKLAHMIINLLKEQNQLEVLPEVIRELQAASKSSQSVIVQSAQELSSESKAGIEELIESRLGYKPTVKYELEPDLIAGIRIQINDQLIDASIKQRLEEVFRKIH